MNSPNGSIACCAASSPIERDLRYTNRLQPIRSNMARQDFAFFHSLRVRWAEVDMQGIVFNGHYLTYFDVAFTEYWRETGLPSPLDQAKAGQEMFARKATVEFLSPARFDDILDIGVRCAGFGRSS